MTNHLPTLARRALAAAAVALVAGAAACGESPTAPGAPSRVRATTSVVKPQPHASGAKRGGYNVVAD
jgi:hypothetical protein